ncbi:MAG TPA: hypothetical protein VGN97_00115 [Mesorhizobium sp.]|jgi:hypothetical protein|nr:hypothetical protein [Mesorhizobium sp.]
MVAEPSHGSEAGKVTGKKPQRSPKPRSSALELLSPDDLQTLRLDESSRNEFDGLVERFSHSRASLQPYEGEDIGSMDDARYDQLAACQAKHSSDATAVVHFLAPRILRLRDGAAKRKWRSFLTKFRKDEKLS